MLQTFMLYTFIEIMALVLFSYGCRRNIKGMIDSRKKICIIYSFILLLCVIIFRNTNVGTDYNDYLNAIRRVQTDNMYSSDEQWLSVGFRLTIKVISMMSFNDSIVPFIVVGLTATITLYCFYKAFYELSSYPPLSLYIFISFCLYFQIMNQFRQMFAIAVSFFAYKYIDKSIVKYMLLILIAALFHSSAIIMIPLYFVVKFEINYKIIITYITMSTISLLCYDKILILLSKTTYGSTYIGWSKYNGSFETSVIINLFVRIILLVISMGVYRRIVDKKPKSKILYHMIIICTILQIFTVFSYIFGRITTYFYVYYILLLPDVIKEYRKFFAVNSKWMYDLIVYLTIFLYECVYYFSQGAVSGGYDVYSTIFSSIH